MEESPKPTPSDAPASAAPVAPSPAKDRSRKVVVLASLAVLVAVLTFLAAALTVTIFARKQEARNPYVKFIEVDENTTDPSVWAVNWPRQYDSYKRTTDAERTRYGGSDGIPKQKLDSDPWLRTMWAGHAFTLDYREARGHAYMLLDQEENIGIFISYATPSDTKGRDTFVETFYDHYYPVELEPVTPPADFDERAARYAGTYKFWRHNQTTLEKAMGLMGGGLEVAPSGEGTLIFAGFGEPKQYVEVGENLFRQVDGPHRIAFGENEDGEIVDLHIEGLPFMDASRAPAFESGLFKMLLPLVCLLLFITVFLGWCYRRKEYKLMEARERNAIRFSMGMAGANLLFVIFLAIILSVYQMELFQNIPFIFDLNLVLPIVASLLTIGVVYHAVQAWREGYWRKGRRVHYTLVALAGIYMTVFYWYWNILGFQHF